MRLIRRSRVMAGLAVTGLAGITAFTAGGATAQPQKQAGCTPATSFQAIIDDSGSMSGSDPGLLRLQGLKLLLQNPDNANRFFGAVEFGSTAKLIFAPGRIGQFRPQMEAALTNALKANDGGTNYNDGITAGVSNNPSANARIFLTDGEHFGAYNNPHALPNGSGKVPPMYVVGLDIGPAIGTPSPGTETSAQRLQRIANETKGQYFPSVTAATLQRTFNQISARLNCLAAPVDLSYPVFLRQGQTKNATANLTSSTKSVDIVVNWANAQNQFTVSRITFLGKKNKRLAISSAKKKRKLKRIKRTRKFASGTFTGFRVKKPKGTRKIRVTLKANRLTSFGGEAPSAQITLRR